MENRITGRSPDPLTDDEVDLTDNLPAQELCEEVKQVTAQAREGLLMQALSVSNEKCNDLILTAKCANCGTDAASEERRMAERAAREESERRLKEIHERREREQREVVERPESNVGQDNDNGIGDRTSSKYSYGKGD